MGTVKQLLWWLIAGSEGGFNRARILQTLHEKPCNANQLAEILTLDYKTIRHHIEVLEKNDAITSMGDKYAKMYFMSRTLEENYGDFKEIWDRIGEKEVNRAKDKDVKR
ncbi:MAG: winged helix-turn-helix transcriptional regulator [Euryarchaeota archaeon]|nr:winged helix-turn-helix transcriptional regulator [Euryarchaeota archaeon]